MEGDRYIKYNPKIKFNNGYYTCISCKKCINPLAYKLNHDEECTYNKYQKSLNRLDGCVYNFGDNEKWRVPFLITKEYVDQAIKEERTILIRINYKEEEIIRKKHYEYVSSLN